jgi:hypothetical protein
VVSDTLNITLAAPTPVRVWALSAFSDQVQLRPAARYRITEATLERAFHGGATAQDVIRFLETELGGPLPEAASARLNGWAAAYRRVRVKALIAVEPDDPAQIEEIARVLREAGWEVTTEARRILAEPPEIQRLERALESVSELLDQAGFTTRHAGPPSELANRDERDDGPQPGR